MRFDDLASQRVTVVDIDKALKDETPYLLFYQIAPIDGDPGHITTGEYSMSTASERNGSFSEFSSTSALTNPIEETPFVSGRPSLEVPVRDDPRGRSPYESRRTSVVAFQDTPSHPPPDYPSDKSSRIPGDGTVDHNPPRPERSPARTEDKGGETLGRRLSRLARKSRDIMPSTESKAEVSMTELSNGTSSEGHSSWKTTLLPESTKGHKREKSRSRLARSKNRGDKPDRECLVM
jgi:hypothetical protein